MLMQTSMASEEQMNVDFKKIKKFFKNAAETIKKITLPQTQNQEIQKQRCTLHGLN